MSYKKSVLLTLNSCKIFHFVGHEFIDDSNPFKDHLLLEDWETESLTIAKFLEKNLRKQMSFFAYFSTCEIDQIKYDKFIHESLHLINACQFAEFLHVVDTLWKVNDKSCVNMTIKTYEWMRNHEMSDKSVSEKLHHASKYFRRQWIKKNSSKEVFKRGRGVQNTRNGETTLNQFHSTQGEAEDIRDAKMNDDKKLSPLNWVSYVHFGV